MEQPRPFGRKERELGGTGVAAWGSPTGGYFIAVDTLDGCAKETVRLAAEAGVGLPTLGIDDLAPQTVEEAEGKGGKGRGERAQEEGRGHGAVSPLASPGV